MPEAAFPNRVNDTMLPLVSDAEIDRWLLEDIPYGDLTTQLLGIGERPGYMRFTAREAMVIAASEEAARLLNRVGCTVQNLQTSGTTVAAGDVLITVEGSATALLAGWKVAQTLMEYASGIATAAHHLVAAARTINPTIVIACTRKTFPGVKAMSIKAILAGGATPHRLNLSETVLVFPEHCAFLATEELPTTLVRLKTACPERKIVVEVNDFDEAIAAVHAGADVVQLEKFSPATVATVVERLAQIAPQVKVAAAGGVNVGNAADYAQAGAHILVTSAPYTAPPADVQVHIRAR